MSAFRKRGGIGFGHASDRAKHKHVKNDEGKPKFNLVPPRALLAVAEALTYGEEKYPGNDYRKVEDGYNRYDNAARRHQNAYDRGELVDEATELLHLAHEIVNKLFMLELLILTLEAQAAGEEDE